MSETAAGLLSVLTLVVALVVFCVPLGTWIATVFTDTRHWRVERLLYRVAGVDPERAQGWRAYAVSVGAVSVVGFVLLLGLILLQTSLPLRQGSDGMGVTTAINTAVSFVTNTNWQSYAGEAGVTPLVQTAGLTVQNFVSAAVGLAVCIALTRALTADGTGRLGNFWVDLVRGTVRILLPGALVGAVVLLVGGVIQNLSAPTTVTGLSGVEQVIRGGLVASQEAIKELGTNGGGYFNANSAHPFENPNPFTNIVEIFLLLVVPFALPRAFGIMVGDRRQGRALLGFASVLFAAGVALTTWAEVAASSAATGSMEGKEQRFGVWASTLFGAARS